MKPTKLREIPVRDAQGNVLAIEEWREVRFINQLGKQIPVPKTWYMCKGMEVTQSGTFYLTTEQQVLTPL